MLIVHMLKIAVRLGRIVEVLFNLMLCYQPFFYQTTMDANYQKFYSKWDGVYRQVYSKLMTPHDEERSTTTVVRREQATLLEACLAAEVWTEFRDRAVTQWQNQNVLVE